MTPIVIEPGEDETPQQAAAAITSALIFLTEEAYRAGLNRLALAIGSAAELASRSADPEPNDLH